MSISELFRVKVFWLLMAMMLCAGASEQAVSQWASTFAEKGLHIQKTVGDLVGPMLFSVLMGLSRLIYGKYGEKFNLDRFMKGSCVLCVASYLCISLVPVPIVGLIGCAICGFSGDPHLTESYDTFAKGPAELAARDYTEKDLNDLIVGAVAKLDTPRKPRAEARELDRQYFCGITEAMKAADRKALCAVDAALLKEQAAGLADAMAAGVKVTFGSRDAVEAAGSLFDRVEIL